MKKRILGSSMVYIFFAVFALMGLESKRCYGQGAAQTLYFPPNALTQEGEGLAMYPLSSPGGRIQQFYAGSDFPSTSPLITITSVAFRVNGSDQFGDLRRSFPRLTVILSTTSRNAKQITGDLALNTGRDAVTVFDGPITFNAAPSPGPAPFAVVIPFTTPFNFDRNAGNLLLDFARGDVPPPGGDLDMFTSSTSNYAFVQPEATRFVVGHALLATKFEYTVVPEPAVLSFFGLSMLMAVFFRIFRRGER